MAQQDLISLLAGDPMGRVEQGEEYAKANLAQYKHQKEIVEEINAAVKAAQDKAKKKKGLFGLGGSLLGGLLGIGGNMLFPGMGAPMQRILQGAMGGLASGAAEKYRQDKYDVTGELEALKEKFKGRKQEQALDTTITSLDDALEGQVMSAGTTGAISSAMMPTNIGKGVGFDPTKAVSDTNIAGPFSKISPTATMVSGGPSLVKPSTFMPTMSSGVPAFGFENELAKAVTPDWLGLDKIVPSMLESGLGQTALGAGRFLGGPLYQEHLTPEWTSDPYYAPQFRNPYGQTTGGY